MLPAPLLVSQRGSVQRSAAVCIEESRKELEACMGSLNMACTAYIKLHCNVVGEPRHLSPLSCPSQTQGRVLRPIRSSLCSCVQKDQEIRCLGDCTVSVSPYNNKKALCLPFSLTSEGLYIGTVCTPIRGTRKCSAYTKEHTCSFF